MLTRGPVVLTAPDKMSRYYWLRSGAETRMLRGARKSCLAKLTHFAFHSLKNEIVVESQMTHNKDLLTLPQPSSSGLRKNSGLRWVLALRLSEGLCIPGAHHVQLGWQI